MANGLSTQPAPADRQTLEAVRPAVRDLLLSVPSYQQLSPEEQQKIASGMVKIASYMANPSGALAPSPISSAQADAVDATKQRLAKAPGQVGQDFKAGAVEQGVQQFGELVKKVDFPQFVGGLIKNVFQAIVESSIEQMRAYGELVANVAKTVDEFAQDNISENNSRDWLAGKYPDALGVSTGTDSGFADGDTQAPPSPKLQPKGDVSEETLKKISTDMNMEKPVTDLSDEAEEARLVQAARLQMARGRQQLLASMVIMGINRIVVTDGLINAKVIFDMRASDTAKRQATASMADRQSSSLTNKIHAEYGGWMSPVSGSVDNEYKQDHVATVQSSVDDQSESKAEVKAKLSGEVRVNFKSDYFPMDKMASPQMIAAIQGNAKPPEKAVSGS
jgi:hypothetical protein